MCSRFRSCGSTELVAPPARPRVVLLTDYWKDPDEVQSMIRFLSCANEFEIERPVATSLAYG